MTRKALTHRKLEEEDFLQCYFSFAGTIVSGQSQEIDVYRPDEPFDDLDIEIRVIMNLVSGQLDFSSLSLTDTRGAPVLLINKRDVKLDDETAEVMMFEAIERDDKAMDYSYGRPPRAERVKPGTFIEAKCSAGFEPEF